MANLGPQGRLIEAAYGEHPAQYVRLHLPGGEDEGLTTFVIVHGGFWKNRYGVHNAAIESLAPDLIQLGYAAVEVEYRRRDHDGGGWPGSCDDIVAALRFLDVARTNAAGWRRIDTAKLVVLGHSAGGHGALFASNRSVAGDCPVPKMTVAVAPVADLIAAFERRLSDEGDAVERFMRVPYGDTSCGLYRAASPIHSMLPLATPTLIVTGSKDIDVPPDLTRSFARCATQAAETHRSSSVLVPDFLEIDGADHYTVLNATTQHWRCLLARIEARLSHP